MKKLFITITFLALLVGNLFAYPVKSSFSKITELYGITYYWNLEATTPMDAPSSKDWNNWVSEMKENGYVCIFKREIPLTEALENHTVPIAEVLLARSYGLYNIYAIYENDFYVSTAHYFVSEKAIFLSIFSLTKQR